jgi:glycosyltransferase involved in cell wall biosynthesis
MLGDRPFTVINNGIKLEKFKFSVDGRETLREKYNLSGKTVIGHIGMFNDIKNQDFLLDILAGIIKTDPNYALVLVGDGERRDLISRKAKEMGIANSVIFTGLTDRVAEHLSLFDVFALPSFFEGLPLVLVESQASGLYSIASDRVTKEADKTGNISFLSIDNGSEIWAEEILKRKDKEERKEASEVAIKTLKEKGYSAEDEAEKLLKFYKNAVKSK